MGMDEAREKARDGMNIRRHRAMWALLSLTWAAFTVYALAALWGAVPRWSEEGAANMIVGASFANFIACNFILRLLPDPPKD